MFALFQEEYGRYLFQDFDNGGIEITDEYCSELISLQSAGSVIQPDDDNYPVAVSQNLAAEIKVFTPLEFLEKFTQEEQLNVVSATMRTAGVKLWYDKMLAASFVDLIDQRTVEGLQFLVSEGLISAARLQEILQGNTI